MLFLLVCLCFFICFSCTTVTSVSPEIQNAQATVLTLPTPAELRSQYVDPLVQADLEMASPASLKRAVERVYATSTGTSKEKQVLLTLAARLMQLLYPLEAGNWNMPSYKQSDPYLDALTQIEKNIFPQSLGINTFFDAIIPPLILTKGIGVPEFATTLETRLFAARKINPHSVLPFYLLGLLYEQLNNLSEAEDYYQIAWEQDNSCYPAGMRFVSLSLLRDNIEKAREIAEKLYERYPDAVTVQLLLSETYIAVGDFGRAESLISAIVKKNGEQSNVFFLRVRFHIEKKEYLAATALLDEFAKKNKVDKDYLLLRARVLREWSKNITEAKQCLEKAEALYPQAADVILACANFCFETKNTINGKTIHDLIDILLRQNPRNILAIRLLVKQDIAEKRWDNAFERAQYLYSNNPSEEDIMLYTQVCAGMNNWQEAVNTSGAAYNAAEKPSDEIITLYLEALYGANKYAVMKRIISRHLTDARSTLKSVLLYYQAILETNDEEKLSLLRLSLLSDPRSVSTLFALYEWYFRHKDYRKAAYYLQQVLALEPTNALYLKLAEKLEKL